MREQPVLVLCATVAVLYGALPAVAAERSAFIGFGATADAPAGFEEMCARDPHLCESPGDRTPDAGTVFPLALPVPDGQPVQTCDVSAISPKRDPQRTLKAPCRATRVPQYLHSASLTSRAAIARPRQDGPKIAAADGKSRRSLAGAVRSVNIRVNRSVRQRSDLQVYGTDEYWQPAGIGPMAVGDCEDIALQKKALLLESGFPADRLFLAVVFRSGIGLHTVLVARLDKGDVVLDSATSPVWNWRKTPYSWLRVQSPDDPRQWFRVAAG